MRSAIVVLHVLLGASLVAGCMGDKAIDLSLQLPAADVAMQFNASCVKSIELFADGPNYQNDLKDYTRDCHEITGEHATFEAVRAAIAGKFNLALPPNGLGTLELYAYAGGCDADPTLFDLSFYASAKYTEGDAIELPLVPNVSCEPHDVTVRPVDVLKLVATKACASSAWTTGSLALTTLSPVPFFAGLDWWGRQSQTPIAGGVATIHGNTKIGPHTCLAAGLFTDDWRAVTCITPIEQSVCAGAGELEVPMLNLAVATASRNPTKLTTWGAMTVGAVIGGSPLGPIAGATVAIDDADKDKGELVMLDMAPGVENGTGALTEHAGATTGASGLFGVYTTTFVRINVTANGKTVKRTISAFSPTMASSVIVKL